MMSVEARPAAIKLRATLDALGVSYPPDGAGNADWYDYLVYLRILAMEGDLDAARELDYSLDAKETPE